jgi:hypothetical protein
LGSSTGATKRGPRSREGLERRERERCLVAIAQGYRVLE